MHLPVIVRLQKEITPETIRSRLLSLADRYCNLILYGLVFIWLGSGSRYLLMVALLLPLGMTSGISFCWSGKGPLIAGFLASAVILYLPSLLRPPLEMLNFLFVLVLYLSISHIPRRNRRCYLLLSLLEMLLCNLEWVPADWAACGLLTLIFLAGMNLLPAEKRPGYY